MRISAQYVRIVRIGHSYVLGSNKRWRGFLLCQYDDNIILISRKDCVNDNEWNHYRNQIHVESVD